MSCLTSGHCRCLTTSSVYSMATMSLDNTWMQAQDRAKKAGRILGEVLEKRVQGERPVILVSHGGSCSASDPCADPRLGRRSAHTPSWKPSSTWHLCSPQAPRGPYQTTSSPRTSSPSLLRPPRKSGRNAEASFRGGSSMPGATRTLFWLECAGELRT